MRKNTAKIIIPLVAALGISACGGAKPAAPAETSKAPETKAESAEKKYTAGSYKVTADGFGGPIEVEVTVDEEKITKVEILSNSETDGVGSKAVDALPVAIVEANSAEVDGVAGATVSSDAIKLAVEKALKQASGEGEEAAELKMTPGSYTASAKGNNGDVTVKIEVTENEIKSIEIVDHKESKGIYNVPFERIPKEIIDNQSLAVDAVAGATVSSNALLSAVKDCVEQAGGDPQVFADRAIPKPEKTEEEHSEYNVVVVGGGLSGLTAAISAIKGGAKVALIEKQAFLGGTTMLATGTIRYADQGDGAAMVESILEEGAPFRNEGDKYPLVEYLNAIGEVSYKSTEIYNEAGLDMQPVEGRPYVQKPTTDGKAGQLYIDKLETLLDKLGGAIYKSTPATELLTDESGKVVGVVSDTDESKKTFHADAVILASGDFARNLDMASKYDAYSTGNFTGTAVGNTGDGLNMAVNVGAATWDEMFSMGGAFVFNPYDSYRAGKKESESLENSLFVSLDGERRIKEDASPKFTQAVYKNKTEADSYWDVMDAEIAKGTEQPIDEMIAGNGGPRIALKADSLEELAKLMNVDEKTFLDTVNRYNELCEKGVDEDFGKDPEKMQAIKTAPFYAVRAYCVTRGIAGGIKTNTSAEVLKEDGSVIPGLYASGAVASRPFYGGAYQGAAAFSVAGNMGYIAGENAAKFVEK